MNDTKHFNIGEEVYVYSPSKRVECIKPERIHKMFLAIDGEVYYEFSANSQGSTHGRDIYATRRELLRRLMVEELNAFNQRMRELYDAYREDWHKEHDEKENASKEQSTQ